MHPLALGSDRRAGKWWDSRWTCLLVTDFSPLFFLPILGSLEAPELLVTSNV